MFEVRSSQARGRSGPDFDDYDFFSEQSSGRSFDLRQFASMLWRGKLLLLSLLLLGVLFGLFRVLQQEPVFIASATVLYEPERIQIVDISDVLSENDTASGIGNQIEILTSTNLLGRVARKLKAESVAEGSNPVEPVPVSNEGFLDPILSIFGKSRKKIDYSKLTEEEREARALRDTINSLLGNMGVSQISGSGVIEIDFTSADPVIAARAVNTVADEYISFQRDSKNQDVLAVQEMIDARIDEMNESVADSEKTLENARIELAEKRSQSAQMTSVQLTALNQELAEMRLRLAESRSRHARAARAVSEGDDLWTVTEFRESALIIEFRRRGLTILEELARDSAITGDSITPSSVRAKALLEQLDNSILEEAGYIVAALAFEVESLDQREDQLEGMVRALERTAIEQTADELAIDRLEREVQSNQGLLQTFVARQKEISEQANLQSADARILSRADPPSRPNYEASARTLVGYSGLGLIFGLAILLVRDFTDQSVHDPRDLRELTGLPVLASIPMKGMSRKLLKIGDDFIKHPQGLLAESVRNLRTSILYSDPSKQPKVVMLTSSVPGEGKSSLSYLTALASQTTGRRTLLVSCDLRDQDNAKIYSVLANAEGVKKGRPGLGDLLQRRCTLEEAVAVEPNTGLEILALNKTDVLKENPADVLSSQRFADIIEELREKYELVILDSPPTLAVTDARLLARHTDTVVYLVRWNRTNKNAVREGLRELKSLGAPISGCVFTLVSQAKAKRYADNEFTYKHGYGGYFR